MTPLVLDELLGTVWAERGGDEPDVVGAQGVLDERHGRHAHR